MKQTTLGEHAPNTPTRPAVGRDEWGPTAHHPIPQPEAFLTVDELELRRRGFSPDTLADERELVTVGRRWHADDAHRPEHEPDAEAERTAADLASQRPRSRPLPPAERAPPEWYVAADPDSPLFAQDLDPRGSWLYHDGAERFRAVATGEPPAIHPDDEHREDHHPEAEEAAISADLARLSDTMQLDTTTDDGQSNEQQATDGARGTTRAVADGGRDEVTATMQEYRDAHPDYRGEVNGRKAVLKMTPNGTALIAVEEGGE